jgi:antitoxin PrlF
MVSSTITTKGQTTIPQEIRELLNLQPGSRINFVVESGRVYIEPATIITTKGQTTIPQEIRELLNLQPGSRINFVVESGRVYIEPATIPVESLSGKYRHLVNRSSVSIEEMDEDIAIAVIESLGVEIAK